MFLILHTNKDLKLLYARKLKRGGFSAIYQVGALYIFVHFAHS